MSRVVPPPPTAPAPIGQSPSAPAGSDEHGGVPGSESRNFFLLVAHQVFFRVGWVFKTESIVMPYFLDVIGGGPVLRSWLMVLNRIGASVPPTLYARRLKLMRQKRWSLMATTIGSGVPFAAMSVLWASGAWREADGGVAWWTKWYFLAMYAWFFVVTGLNQLSIQTVQGKLVRAERRGRLFTTGVLFGCPLAILAVVMLMPRWLALPDGGFAWIFAAPGVAFLLSGLMMLGVRETDDDFTEVHEAGWRRFRRAAWLAFEEPKLRGVAIAAALYSSAFALFPHYATLAREAAGAGFDIQSLVTWTVTQHSAVAVVSLLAGPIADRFGARHAVQMTMLGAALAPITAIVLATTGDAGGGQLFWLVFLPLGFTPVTNKMLLNYTLELVDREHHTLYTSAVGLCLAVPVIGGSLLAGVLIGWLGVVPVFTMGAVVMLLAFAQTLRLAEPRRQSV
ncbi:Major Facilitator Superfamily protein [Botrimarina colliarenosi]|uniref:Major Facilitator Superfamily protein n=1 Tax=Botrimarina colliarenosi TaxID=2528001 RepID=A0A5C6AJY4_9BACT|nr:MFS transporter [Botrimarina colliarenosi]TWT99558.1 Major Facilitator Superfamily protein [Botrimarina colliarenosi]